MTDFKPTTSRRTLPRMPRAEDNQSRVPHSPRTHTSQAHSGLSLTVPGNGAGHEAQGKSLREGGDQSETEKRGGMAVVECPSWG